jgi:hypothetical protein
MSVSRRRRSSPKPFTSSSRWLVAKHDKEGKEAS